ncbi:putative tRNA pseudouridine synthase Pus10 [Rhizophlyctis rosea]|uniref:tRNA pseudouridine(55) synthase n=1 Tax=Rhizophlyctis rosea TaxID=64517 RepID=A0AAD5X6P8_9FUNG|nr:putative tRNA pseudouridine synthase Pus10 [Rhizophlyctis rosea]
MTASATIAKRFLAQISPSLLPPVHNANPAAWERLTGHLVSANFCPRCVLRFLGIRDRVLHRHFPSQLGVIKVANKDELLERMEAGGAPSLDSLKTEADDAHADMTEFVENGKGVKRERDAEDEGEKRIKPSPTLPPISDPTTSTQSDASYTVKVELTIEVPFNDTPQTAYPPDCTCPACLGLLQMDHKSLSQRADGMYTSENYVLGEQTFVVSMRLPAQLAIRQRAGVLFVESVQRSDDIAPEAIETKEILRNLLTDTFSEITGLTFSSHSPFSVNFHIDHPETTTEYEFMTQIPEADFKIKKARQKGQIIIIGAGPDKITKAVGKLELPHFKAAHMIPPPAVHTEPKVVEVTLSHGPVYVAGRYNKYKRGISNSPWEIGGTRLAEDSVEELICPKIDAAFRCQEHRFSSAGREDADVLMLGHGRPFYFELVNPKVAVLDQERMSTIEKQINAHVGEKVGVRDLQVVTKEGTRVLKDSAATKSKSYSCLIRLSEPVTQEKLDEVSALGQIKVAQQNPSRVPRRADLLRHKLIESLHLRFDPLDRESSDNASIRATKSSDPLSSITLVGTHQDIPPPSTDHVDEKAPTFTQIRADMRTSAGTYVKEFVHGDGGRTNPCLAGLLGVERAEVLALDVLEVHLDWPGKVDVEGVNPIDVMSTPAP